VTIAHLAGLPVEETLAMCGPALLASVGAAGAWLRGRRYTRSDLSDDEAAAACATAARPARRPETAAQPSPPP
jgi:hypothetical protein